MEYISNPSIKGLGLRNILHISSYLENIFYINEKKNKKTFNMEHKKFCDETEWIKHAYEKESVLMQE